MATSLSKKKYVVEKILGEKTEDNTRLLHIKWKGYPNSKATWQPYSQMKKDIPEMVREYEATSSASSSSASSASSAHFHEIAAFLSPLVCSSSGRMDRRRRIVNCEPGAGLSRSLPTVLAPSSPACPLASIVEASRLPPNQPLLAFSTGNAYKKTLTSQRGPGVPKESARRTAEEERPTHVYP